MRNINAAVLKELGKEELRPFVLLDMTPASDLPYRYTDCDVPIAYASLGQVFLPRGFTYEPIRFSKETIVEELNVSIDNLDDVFTTRFVAGTPQGDIVTLYMVVLNSSNQILGDRIMFFQGALDDWNLDEGKLTFSVVSEFVRWSQRTLSKHGKSCRWKEFKGTECAYAGAETWCDRTYKRCLDISNADNFGGFRWLPSIVDKEVWWGREQG